LGRILGVGAVSPRWDLGGKVGIWISEAARGGGRKIISIVKGRDLCLNYAPNAMELASRRMFVSRRQLCREI